MCCGSGLQGLALCKRLNEINIVWKGCKGRGKKLGLDTISKLLPPCSAFVLGSICFPQRISSCRVWKKIVGHKWDPEALLRKLSKSMLSFMKTECLARVLDNLVTCKPHNVVGKSCILKFQTTRKVRERSSDRKRKCHGMPLKLWELRVNGWKPWNLADGSCGTLPGNFTTLH